MNRGIRTQQQECDHEWSDKGYCKRCDADRPDEVVEIGGETFKMRSKENGDVVLDHQDRPDECRPDKFNPKCTGCAVCATPQQECEHGVKLTDKELRELIDKLEYPPQQECECTCHQNEDGFRCNGCFDCATPQQEIERLEKVEIGSSDGWTDYKYPNFRDVHDKLNEVIDWINNHD